MEYEEVEEVAESTTANDEEVVESSTTEEDSFSFSEDDPIEDDETEEPDSELSTEGEVEEPEVQEKSNVQKRMDTLTREKKEALAAAAHAKNTNEYLLKQLSTQRTNNATAPAPIQPLKEPVYSDYEEKHHGDVDAAQRAYFRDYTKFEIAKDRERNKQQEVARAADEKFYSDKAAFDKKTYSEDVSNKFPDFSATVYHPTVTFTAEVSALIMSSPQGHDIAYKLAKDDDLRNRINNMSSAMAGKEIGSLERLFATPVNRKFKSKAPKGIKPVGTKSNAKGQTETDMPIEEFLKRERKKRAEAEFF
jgi:hypothetical protein